MYMCVSSQCNPHVHVRMQSVTTLLCCIAQYHLLQLDTTMLVDMLHVISHCWLAKACRILSHSLSLCLQYDFAREVLHNLTDYPQLAEGCPGFC